MNGIVRSSAVIFSRPAPASSPYSTTARLVPVVAWGCAAIGCAGAAAVVAATGAVVAAVVVGSALGCACGFIGFAFMFNSLPRDM